MIDKLSEILENTMIVENTIVGDIASLLDMEEGQASSIIKQLSFSQYLELSSAMAAEDEELVKSLLSIEEESNPYRSAKTPNSPNGPVDTTQGSTSNDGEMGLDTKTIAIGSTLNIDGKDVSVKDVDKANHVTTISTQDGQEIEYRDKNAPPEFTPGSADGAQAEIDRIKKLAGIEEGGAIASAAIAGAVTGPATIRDRHRKKKKPGPKA